MLAMGFRSISNENPFELFAWFIVTLIMNLGFIMFNFFGCIPKLQVNHATDDKSFLLAVSQIIAINFLVLHFFIVLVYSVLFYSVYNKFALITYSKIGSDLYMQWAYKYYQLAKFSNLLSAILGTLQLVMLFVFEPTWKFYIVYAIVWLVFGAGLYFGYNGLRKQEILKTIIGLWLQVIGLFAMIVFFV